MNEKMFIRDKLYVKIEDLISPVLLSEDSILKRIKSESIFEDFIGLVEKFKSGGYVDPIEVERIITKDGLKYEVAKGINTVVAGWKCGVTEFLATEIIRIKL